MFKWHKDKKAINKYTLICIAIVLLTTNLAWSNAINPYKYGLINYRQNQNIENKSTPIDSLVELISIVLEALLAAIILNRFGFKFSRIFCVWLAITFISLRLLNIFIESSLFIFNWTNLEKTSESGLRELPMILTIIVGEILVIFYEAWAVRMISFSSFFHRNRSSSLESKQAFCLSGIVNLVSLTIGFSMFYIYEVFTV